MAGEFSTSLPLSTDPRHAHVLCSIVILNLGRHEDHIIYTKPCLLFLQVLLTVKAVGLNFRDVLNVLGMYPGDPGEPGGDVAGIVAAVGSEARHLHR